MLVFWQLKCNTDWPKSPAPLQPGQVIPAGPESAATAVVLEILKETKCFELLHLFVRPAIKSVLCALTSVSRDTQRFLFCYYVEFLLKPYLCHLVKTDAASV